MKAPDMFRKIAWDRFILLGASQGKNAGRSSPLAGKRCRGQDYFGAYAVRVSHHANALQCSPGP